MVEYTTSEMLCYNSLLNGKKIQGIRLMFPPMLMKKQILEETIAYLKKERLAEESGELTAVGEAKLHIIRKYKEADRYVAINNIAVSFQKGRSMIMAVQTKEDSFTFEIGDRAGIMLGLLREYDFLRQEEKKKSEYRTNFLTDEGWKELMAQIETRNLILVQKYKNEDIIEDIALFCYEGNCYELNVTKKMMKEKPVSEIRKRLMELLELEDE